MVETAKLTILLKANDTLVATSDDPQLWQRVLAVIHGGGELAAAPSTKPAPPASGRAVGAQPNDDIAKFAELLDVAPEVVRGALSPSREPPYLELNARYWEPFRKALPQRGVGAVAPIAFASTALALWLREANLGISATQGVASQILDTIGLKDPNPSRGVRNTDWLQARSGGAVGINPAELSRAIEIVRAYCLKKAPTTE